MLEFHVDGLNFATDWGSERKAKDRFHRRACLFSLGLSTAASSASDGIEHSAQARPYDTDHGEYRSLGITDEGEFAS